MAEFASVTSQLVLSNGIATLFCDATAKGSKQTLIPREVICPLESQSEGFVELVQSLAEVALDDCMTPTI